MLSAYAPHNIPGLHWGILAEIDEEEAFAAVDELGSSIASVAITVAVIMLAIGAAIAFFVGAMVVIKPIMKLVDTVSSIERNSDLTQCIDIRRSTLVWLK